MAHTCWTAVTISCNGRKTRWAIQRGTCIWVAVTTGATPSLRCSRYETKAKALHIGTRTWLTDARVRTAVSSCRRIFNVAHPTEKVGALRRLTYASRAAVSWERLLNKAKGTADLRTRPWLAPTRLRTAISFVFEGHVTRWALKEGTLALVAHARGTAFAWKGHHL